MVSARVVKSVAKSVGLLLRFSTMLTSNTDNEVHRFFLSYLYCRQKAGKLKNYFWHPSEFWHRRRIETGLLKFINLTTKTDNEVPRFFSYFYRRQNFWHRRRMEAFLLGNQVKTHCSEVLSQDLVVRNSERITDIEVQRVIHLLLS